MGLMAFIDSLRYIENSLLYCTVYIFNRYFLDFDCFLQKFELIKSFVRTLFERYFS